MIGRQRFRKPVKEEMAAGMAAGQMEESRDQSRPEVPEGMFCKCDGCGKMIYQRDVEENRYICPKCGKYFRIGPKIRIDMVTDPGTFQPWDEDIRETNPLDFPGYEEKLQTLQEKTGLEDAVVTGEADIRGYHTAIGVMASEFMMGSMGTVVGERITRMVERATKERLPVVLFCCSGGARMQEGILSLMQMAKISQALQRHHQEGLLYLSVLTDPTMGGVTASFAMLGDVILAEPGAMIGFAGARVIRQTIGQKLPEGFQSAEFLQSHGFVDRIVKRESMRRTLWFLLSSLDGKQNRMNREAQRSSAQKEHRKEENLKETNPGEVNSGKVNPKETGHEGEDQSLSPWERVCAARSLTRPAFLDYVQKICSVFLELRGDRYYGDDRAVIGGIGALEGRYVMVIGQQKGRSMAENKHRNFGMPSPEGYRKALRLMKLAEKFRLPVLLFVDTPGAFCGVEAEERGQGEAIARNLFEMAGLTVPVLSIVIGEGGSGGALGMAVANQVWMLENAVYSVLSPEGFAAILWKDGKRVQEAAGVMKLTAAELKELGIIEQIIPEVQAANREDMEPLASYVKQRILKFLEEYENRSAEEICRERYDRFRKIADGR